MLVLFIVLNKVEVLEDLLENFNSAGIRGATVISSTGMARVLHSYGDDLPFMSSLRMLLDPEREANKTIFTLIKDDKLPDALTAVRSAVGDLSKPDTAIVFTLPVSYAEGVGL